jgi:hypothetical protein
MDDVWLEIVVTGTEKNRFSEKEIEDSTITGLSFEQAKPLVRLLERCDFIGVVKKRCPGYPDGEWECELKDFGSEAKGGKKFGLKGRQIKPKRKTRADRLGDITNALQDTHSDLEGFAEEVREHADNMTGTNLEHTDRYQILEDAANALEDGASELEEIISTLEGVEFP